MEPRISQRPSLACRECQRKKKKCSKDIPCSRCIELGLSCDRDVVYLRRNVARHASEIKFLQSLQGTLQSTSSIDKALRQVKSRLEQLQSGRHLATSPTELGVEESDDAVASGLDETSPTSTLEPSPIITALEQVARGRSSGRCSHHYSQNCPCVNSTASVSTMRQPPISTVDLPGREVAQVLVDFHVNYMAWHHNCLHTPTFLQECSVFWDTGECDNPQWISLYCAVLAVSLFSIVNSPSHQELSLVAANVSRHTPSLLFDKMVSVLHASHFLQNISLYSVQAIAISAEVAHSLGQSQLNATLFNAAIGIAECLGLHKISDGSTEATSEIGRRVWLQLIIQDHFAISFVGSYKIHPQSYSSLPPSNADDDLVPMPDSVPTASTYNRTLLALARLMPELADGLGPMRDPTPVRDKYRHINAMDQKLRKCVQEFPAYLLQRDKLLEARVPWLSVARHSMAITVAEKVIMIHRPFIFYSFQSEQYSCTRRNCVSAAMTILQELKVLVASGHVSMWTHSAFATTAALILAFEVTCHPEDSRCEAYTEAVQEALSLLARREYDVLAQRGIVLITAILSKSSMDQFSGDLNMADESASFEEIMRRFTTEFAFGGLPNTNYPTPTLPLASDYETNDLFLAELGEFGTWFQDTFYSTAFE